MIWTDNELKLLHHALGLVGERMSERPDEYGPGEERTHTDLSLRVSEELTRREALWRLM